MDSQATATIQRAGRVALLVGGNLLPLVGVLAWEWNLTALVLLYGVEGVVTSVFAGLKMLFAERLPSEDFVGSDLPLPELRNKRGGVAIREGWPPVYPRNLPFALEIAGSLIFVWFVLGGFVLADILVSVSAALPATVLPAAVGLVVARAVEFQREYLGNEEYAEVSARGAAGTAGRQVMLVVALLPFLTALDESRAAGTFLLLVVVAVKTLADAYNFWVDHLGRDSFGVLERIFGVAETGEPPPAIDVPPRPVDERIQTDTSAVLFTGLVPITLAFIDSVGLVVVLLCGLLAFVIGLWALVPFVLAVSLFGGASLLTHYVRFGTLEYQRRGDTVVCYDRRLDAPQWVCAVDEIRDPTVDRRITSKVFGTTVLRFTDRSDERYRLGPVADADAAVECLGVLNFDTSQDEPNRQVAVVALGLAGLFLAIPGVLYVAPVATTGEAVLAALFLVPTMVLTVGPLLWVSLYNV